MKALVYDKAHTLEQFAISERTVADPTVGDYDLLVRVKATGINPVDYKIRKSRNAQNSPVILGWDASGVIEKLGSKVSNFKVGDEVYYAGNLLKDGSYAELQSIDSRLVAHKPKSLSFDEAAALPLTSLTAYEGIIERYQKDLTRDKTVLIIGGAGGVGSMLIQLLKAKTQVKIVATASRPESQKWCLDLGAHEVLDHSKNLKDEMSSKNIQGFYYV